MREIKIDIFNERSIDSAIKELIGIEKSLDMKLKELCRRLVEEVGKPIVEAYYSAARLEGNEDYSIDTYPLSNGYALRAEGEQVFFIEFGTGNYAGSIPNDFDTGEIPIYPASWSETHGKQYSEKGYWMYYGVKFVGTVPMAGMQYAKEAIIRKIPELAEEIFK